MTVFNQMGEELSNWIYGENSRYYPSNDTASQSSGDGFAVHNGIIARLSGDLNKAKSIIEQSDNAVKASEQAIRQRDIAHARSIKALEAKLEQVQSRAYQDRCKAVSLEEAVKEARSAHGADRAVANLANLKKAYTKEPLLQLALETYQRTAKNIMESDWAKLEVTTEDVLSADYDSDEIKAPYYFLDRGFSYQLNSFIPVGKNWDVKNYIRAFQLYELAVSFCSYGVAWGEIVQGIFIEQCSRLESNPDELNKMVSSFYMATKQWRTQTSNYDGERDSLIWAVYNQLALRAYNERDIAWNKQPDGDAGVYPIGFVKAFQGDTKFSNLLPTTKLTTFIHEYGPGTEDYEKACKKGLFDVSGLFVYDAVSIPAWKDYESLRNQMMKESFLSA